MAISFLLAPCRSSLARTNALQLCASKKDSWLDKVQRSLGKKRFVNRPLDRTPAKSRRRIGRLRQFQRLRSRWSRAAMPMGRKTRLHPAAPPPRCAREVRRWRQIRSARWRHRHLSERGAVVAHSLRSLLAPRERVTRAEGGRGRLHVMAGRPHGQSIISRKIPHPSLPDARRLMSVNAI